MTPREKRIHAALRELIAEAGGCGEAAGAIGLKKAQLGRMHVDPPEAFMNVFQLSKLEAFVGKPIVTQAMAAMLGFDIAPQEQVAGKALCVHASISGVMGEATQLAKTYAELVADGISPTDATLIENELRDAARAVEHARQACAAIRAKRIA
jgi:hypothetical protein